MERYRIHPEAAVYYLTYSVVEWLPVFVSQETCRIITDSLTFCHRAKHLRINAYVLMPTHLHLIGFDADLDSERLARTLTDFRKYTGRQLSDDCTRHGLKCFLETLRHQSSTTFTTTPAARGWCAARMIADSLRRRGMCRTAFSPLTCR